MNPILTLRKTVKDTKEELQKKIKKNQANPDELIKPGLISKTHNS